MTRPDLINALTSENVLAFLHMLRHGEGTDGPDGYRMMFGGELFENGFADHPRNAVTRTMVGKPITSTAAGAYQFLSRTWDSLVREYGFPDFSPESQDQAAVALIAGRNALTDVLSGRLRDAIAKCSKEWASLPGSPYGQPTVSLVKATGLYMDAGGHINDVNAAPDTSNPTQPNPTPEKKDPAMPPFLLAALPSLLELIPKLGSIFKSGSEVSERNVKAVTVVVEAAKAAIGASNEQDLVEQIKADPAAAATVKAAVESKWLEITEAGGGGIEGARKADAAAIASSGLPFWQSSPSFWIACLLLPLVYLILGNVTGLYGAEWSADARAGIAGSIAGGIVMGLIGYYYGQTTTRNRSPAAPSDLS